MIKTRLGTAAKAIFLAASLAGCSSSTSFTDPGGPAQTCATNCNLNATCAAQTCNLAAGGSGYCSAATPSVCTTCAADCTASPSCQAQACNLAGGGTGTCSGSPSVCTAPACNPNPAGAVTETSCMDGIDNDCNGKIDCAEASCSNQPCKSGSPAFLCVSGACTDTASGYAIVVAPGRTRIPADGVSTTPVVVTVTRNSTPQGGVDLTIDTTRGTVGGAASTTATTGADGKATVTFASDGTAGTATVTAKITANPLVSQFATIDMPALGTVTLPTGGLQYTVMGVRSSGYREINTIVLTVTDDKGAAYPQGLAVRFEHQQLGGSHLSTPAGADTATCVAASGCVSYLAATDASGQARVNLYSGTVAGTLSVVASATAGGLTQNFNVPGVAVIGAKANGANFAIDCAPRNVPALADTNCGTSRVDDQFTCVALLKDRFNNLLGTATQVTFVAEAAAVGQVATTPAYDPTKPPTQQDNLGIATQIFNTLGAALPFDVPPVAGEPSVVHGLDGCGTLTHNPRDGVLTVIAIADGEEAFFDSNGNGLYDLGEPFVDQGEPFVDENDNGQHDPGEWFLDVNQNGVYDGPNGVWDANAKIWTETVVVYTGFPAGELPAGGGLLGSRWVDLGSLVDPCLPTPAATPFSVNAAITGPPAVPATSEAYWAVGSDFNLNLLTHATTYSALVAAGKVTASWRGLASYADDYGFFFQYRPCDQAGNCASQCRATGANLPCLMKPAITGYSCGVFNQLVITGGATPDAGTDVVDWSVSTTYPVLNGSKTVIFQDPIAGTNN